MRRLVLHVGPGRTGTSALQTMFCRHADALAERGVHFPWWRGFDEVKRGRIASGNGGPIAALLTSRAVGSCTTDDGLRELRHLYDECAPIVLYSSEWMSLFETDKLAFVAEFATSAGFITQAAYYTRNHDDYAKSVFARSAAFDKTGGVPEERWIAKYVPPFEQHISGLKSVLGAENVFVRDYDTVKPDLFGDFCSGVLGIQRPPGVMPWLNSGSQQPAVRRFG